MRIMRTFNICCVCRQATKHHGIFLKKQIGFWEGVVEIFLTFLNLFWVQSWQSNMSESLLGNWTFEYYYLRILFVPSLVNWHATDINSRVCGLKSSWSNNGFLTTQTRNEFYECSCHNNYSGEMCLEGCENKKRGPIKRQRWWAATQPTQICWSNFTKEKWM